MRYPLHEPDADTMSAPTLGLARDASVALLRSSHPGAAVVVAMLNDIGWAVEVVEPAMLNGMDGARFDLVVMCAAEISAELLIAITAAAHDPDTRVFVIAEENSPQQIRDVLQAGGDDYLQYPFSAEECLARMRALTARARSVGDRRRQGLLTFDYADRAVSAGPTRVQLTAREWSVLIALLEAEGSPVTSANLCEHGYVFGDLSESALAAIVGRIRRKMQVSGFLAISIVTVRGRGYVARFRRESDSFAAATKIR
jgi:DNA-binding response OmpR family regulator